MSNVVRPDYCLTFVGPASLNVGEVRSLTFWLTRLDAVVVQQPVVTVSVWNGAGTKVVNAATVDVAAAGANLTQVLAFDSAFASVADEYVVAVSAAIADGGDSQTVISRVLVVVA